jgi:hypothetical protein
MNTVDVGITGPVDGMGRLDRSGSYLQLTIITHDVEQRYRISIGAAEILAAEIPRLLGSIMAIT